MSLDLDMTNIAYTDEYKTRRKKKDIVFNPENLSDTKIFEVDGYTAQRSYYSYKADVFDETVVIEPSGTASETVIFAPDGSEIYRFRNQAIDAEFLTLIKHSNGHEYFIFHIDLYGYGVFDITEKKEFFHIPRSKDTETFIWVEVFYNPLNNILVVSGCYWAYPYGLNLLNFSNPMTETKWVDINRNIFPLFEGGSHIDFVRWDGTTMIIKSGEQERHIEESVYEKWLCDYI